MTNISSDNISIVVVTYNRKKLLISCIKNLLAQTKSFSKLIIINNNSTDGTEALVDSCGLLQHPLLHWVNLPVNIGGAGGFHEGLKIALEQGADWVWMMDDDAMAEANALQELMLIASDPNNIYASLATLGNKTSWSMTIKKNNEWHTMDDATAFPVKSEVLSLPFLGFLVHKDLVYKIGLPDKEFFIAADDLEYCLRAQQYGSKLYLAGKSIIQHPRPSSQKIQFFGRNINYVSLPPWKRYYDTRNRIFIAKKYFGFRLYWQTLPSIVFRFILSMQKESSRLKQTQAYFHGIKDGLCMRSGNLHNTYKL